MMATLQYPCEVMAELELDANSVRFIKRQSALLGRCAWFGVGREHHDDCIKHGLVEGVDFSHDPSPFNPVGKITYGRGRWKEQAFAEAN